MSECMQNDKPLVSVIVPVYCSEKYLPFCLESLISQTYNILEIILIDDGSTDCSGKICDQYAKKDRRIQAIHQPNHGVSAARNRGVQLASGDYIAHVDADDWIDQDYIRYLLNLLKGNQSEIALCGCKLPANCKMRVYPADAALKELLYQKQFDTALWGKLFRSDIAKRVLFPDGIFFEDLASVCQMFGMVNYVVCGRWQGYHYRHTPDGTMNGGHIDRLLNELQSADLMERHILQKYPSIAQAAICRKFSAYCQVLMKLPSAGYTVERDKIWDCIRKTRKDILKDGNARSKNRIAAAVSYLGEGAMRTLWKRQMRYSALKY